MENKRKVLIIYNKVWSYRIRIFELLNEVYDLTVAYSDPNFNNKQFNFKTVYLPTKEIGPFTFHLNNLYKVAKNFDVVIGIAQIRWINVMMLGFNPFRKYKLIYWGIGVRASYDNKFDSKNNIDRYRYLLLKRSDALIFYSNYPISKYIDQGFNSDSLFIANNTVDAPFSLNKNLKRQQLLFIGTLYDQKGIEELLFAYKELISEGNILLPLKVIGGGENLGEIKYWVEKNNLNNIIDLMGPIYDKDILEQVFRSSIACISPKQAGLSVLSSMAYGCVFITSFDAITGGERLNIIDGVNGLFYDGTLNGLKERILFVHQNTELISQIGNNAFEYYRKNRTPQIMARGIVEAIEYTLNK